MDHIMESNKKFSRIISIDFNTPCLFRSATAFLYHHLHYTSSSNRMSKRLITIFNYSPFGLRKRRTLQISIQGKLYINQSTKKVGNQISEKFQKSLKTKTI